MSDYFCEEYEGDLCPRLPLPGCLAELEAVAHGPDRSSLCGKLAPTHAFRVECRRPRGHSGVHVSASSLNNGNPRYDGRVWARWAP